jgi:hypothetical protein
LERIVNSDDLPEPDERLVLVDRRAALLGHFDDAEERVRDDLLGSAGRPCESFDRHLPLY